MKPMTDPMSAPAWPPTRFAIPQLWERAKAMFGVVLKQFPSTRILSSWMRLRREARHAILCRLVPVEKIVRLLLVTEAITFLLMTAEGLKLLRTTPKITPPAPPTRSAPHKTTITMPGWHTIAALHPRIDPRVEARKPEPEPVDVHDPENWACRFNVIAWRGIRTEPPPKKKAPKLLEIMGDDWPVIRGPQLHPQKQAPEPEGDPSAYALARRIEALQRMLDNPQPAIRRLAKFIASLPPGILSDPNPTSCLSLWWWHGRPEWFNLNTLGLLAARAFARREDPG